ncbi:alpha/beta-hydrolase [Daldinia loculata]|uniref:alpha/beta-hydrolase n=1 Tax=Daldinia loculata TaxID=103429 RepID=UPI0020C5B30A|nr:alpha/beta-hydrolase [Daldinia loculata]KAI1651152.1 alpha/beta-hydrolase [Daldinia loculata]
MRLNCANAVLVAAIKLLRLVNGQFPNSTSQDLNLTTISSPIDPNIKISYKVPHGACNTAFESQTQYTGWVSLPGDFPTNTFFWFVGARDKQANSSLTIWLNGGPGSSSMFGFFTENGPCEVVDNGTDKFATIAREWGWDRASNMLFIDQPNQVGFSYDVPTKGSINLLTNEIYTPPDKRPDSLPPSAYLDGTFSSMNINHTANTTETAAIAIWHMLQGFLGAFPELNPPKDNVLGVNLFSESYGGKYGPAFAQKWEQMNAVRGNGTVSNSTSVEIRLVSLGIVNGCVDDLIQAPYYPIMAVNNPYGFPAINSVRAKMANASFYTDGGCRDLINQCRTAVASKDPNNSGSVPDVNHICESAYNNCTNNVMLPYSDAGRSLYDIAAPLPDSFPPRRYLEYVNTPTFQKAIGTRLNYTETNSQVAAAFASTGDYEREAMVPKLASLLNSGIRVGFIYGDRDYICNWLGGEAVSLALASSVAGYETTFASAGYAPIIVNDSYVGGAVRQFGNLSFSRVYQAGHFVPAYQPATAFEIFARVIRGDSVSTGENIDLSTYNTTGSAEANSTLDLPAAPSPTCWLRDVPGSCSEEQQSAILNGDGSVVNGVVETGPTVTTPPASAVANPSTTTTQLTGLFTATATPSSVAVSRVRPGIGLGLAVGGGVIIAILVGS